VGVELGRGVGVEVGRGVGEGLGLGLASEPGEIVIWPPDVDSSDPPASTALKRTSCLPTAGVAVRLYFTPWTKSCDAAVMGWAVPSITTVTDFGAAPLLSVNVTPNATEAPTTAARGETVGSAKRPEWPMAEPTARARSSSASGDAVSRLTRSLRVGRTVTPVIGGEDGTAGGTKQWYGGHGTQDRGLGSVDREPDEGSCRPIARHLDHARPHLFDQPAPAPRRWTQRRGVPSGGAAGHRFQRTVTAGNRSSAVAGAGESSDRRPPGSGLTARIARPLALLCSEPDRGSSWQYR
jgi:hypothetical protein